MPRYEIRAAGKDDEDSLLELARLLNTVNLPNDRTHVAELLDHSEKSFSGAIADPRERRYVFLVWDRKHQRAVGTSLIVAQLGKPRAPYIYFDVLSEEKYSHRRDIHFHHTVLRLGFSYKGPTEIGGLVVHPDYRLSKERLGQLISYVRFVYMAIHRELFQKEVLAELLPPLERDGTSHLWEALGWHFTHMSYAEADLLSSRDKTFVRDLFPRGVIYASLLSSDAQAVIGKVGAQTRGVEKMLRRIGFRYAERIDPFDGGPHFMADLNEVSLVRDTQRARIGSPITEARCRRGLVARELASPPYFRAIVAQFETHGATLHLEPALLEHLELSQGDEVWYLPL